MSIFRLSDEPSTNKTTESTKKTVETQIEPTGETSDQTPEQKPVIKEILLKGPLGHAYTEALKLLLDKNTNDDREIRQESVYQALQANVAVDESEGDFQPKSGDETFVYVFDGKRMGMGDLSKLFDDVSAMKQVDKQELDVVTVIENAEELLNKPVTSSMLEQITLSFENWGVPLYFKRSTALVALTNRMKN